MTLLWVFQEIMCDKFFGYFCLSKIWGQFLQIAWAMFAWGYFHRTWNFWTAHFEPERNKSALYHWYPASEACVFMLLWQPSLNTKFWNMMQDHFFLDFDLSWTTIFLKVILILTPVSFFLWGREWYQKLFVGWFIIRRQPCCSSIWTGLIFRDAFLPRASWCLNTKSRDCPRDSDAIGWPLTRSFSSSLCSPMWSHPSLYLGRKRVACHWVSEWDLTCVGQC